jgi:hypothetical protein
VLTFDGRGNGRSDRPAGVASYLEDEFAAAIAAEVGRAVDHRPVETDGAARAASLIAELV